MLATQSVDVDASFISLEIMAKNCLQASEAEGAFRDSTLIESGVEKLTRSPALLSARKIARYNKRACCGGDFYRILPRIRAIF